MKPIKNHFTPFVNLLRIGDRFDIGLVFLFILLNGIVFANAFLHDPTIGYDADGHLAYIQSFSRFHLVTPQDTKEFFSPPLPYVIPSLAIALTGVKLFWAAKLAQFMNGFLSIGLSIFLIKICQLISVRSSLKREALIFLGILPGYYKTFAFVRGEPYVVFFAVAILYYLLLITINKQFTYKNALTLGVIMGLCALSRQWGILMFPAVFLILGFQWIRYPPLRSAILKTIGLCVLLLAVVSGWFYVSLYARYGSVTAFNWEYNARFSFKNQPLEFYVGLSPKLLFTNPVRPNFSDQFVPILYSELWGDYWGYFTIYGINTEKAKFVDGSSISKFFSEGRIPHWLKTNYTTIGTYLGHVNLVSIFPSILAIAAVINPIMVIFKKSTSMIR
jgi:4-amino-4-deoxy-L-arabinose transferase-like glycosyltransferase